MSPSTVLAPTLTLKKRKPSATFCLASAASSSGVALPRSHIGATARRTAPPIRSMTGTLAARPARSSSASSIAECAPVLPMRAAPRRRMRFGRIQASLPVIREPSWRTAATRLPWVSPVMVGAEAASPQPTMPPVASMRTSTFSATSIVTPAIFIGFLSGSADRDRVDPADEERRPRRRLCRRDLHVLGHRDPSGSGWRPEIRALAGAPASERYLDEVIVEIIGVLGFVLPHRGPRGVRGRRRVDAAIHAFHDGCIESTRVFRLGSFWQSATGARRRRGSADGATARALVSAFLASRLESSRAPEFRAVDCKAQNTPPCIVGEKTAPVIPARRGATRSDRCKSRKTAHRGSRPDPPHDTRDRHQSAQVRRAPSRQAEPSQELR